jgi:hypothetical protein
VGKPSTTALSKSPFRKGLLRNIGSQAAAAVGPLGLAGEGGDEGTSPQPWVLVENLILQPSSTGIMMSQIEWPVACLHRPGSFVSAVCIMQPVRPSSWGRSFFLIPSGPLTC